MVGSIGTEACHLAEVVRKRSLIECCLEFVREALLFSCFRVELSFAIFVKIEANFEWSRSHLCQVLAGYHFEID